MIGSHIQSLADLTRLNAASLYVELALSRSILEAQLGQPVLDFCYPAGRYNAAVKGTVGQLGYRTATTAHQGIAQPGDDLLALP